MGTMNASDSLSTDQHREDGVRRRIRFILGVFGDDPKSGATEPVWPMALFAGFRCRYEAIRFHRGLNGSVILICDDLHQLTSARDFACRPALSTRSDMTLHAQDASVSRVLVGRKLR